MKKIYGPYTRKDGRKHIIHYEDGKHRTQSYPRYLMEQHLGRELLPEETVDHINGDFTDDRLENLQLLPLEDNIRKSAKPAEIGWFGCPVCGEIFTMFMREYRWNQGTNKRSGPYCSRKCAGFANNQYT